MRAQAHTYYCMVNFPASIGVVELFGRKKWSSACQGHLLTYTAFPPVGTPSRLSPSQSLRAWLSFRLRRNPFFCPIPLEKLAGISGATQTSRQQGFSNDKRGFYSVGGLNACVRTKNTVEDDSHAPNTLRAGGSAIADDDMVRIRGAAATIVEEEAMHGR